MQYQTGTVSVTNGSPTVVDSTDADWTEVQTALSYGNPVLFSLIGFTEPVIGVIAVAFVTDHWELTLAVNWAGATQSGASYMIHKDFSVNMGLSFAAGGERNWAQLFTRNMVILDAAFGGAGVAVPSGVITTVPSGKTLYVSGELDIPPDAELDILPGGAVEIG